MLTPDKYIRAAYITALSGIGVPVFDMLVPKTTTPIPKKRIIISSQTKVQHNTSKCGHNWMCTINLEVISEQPLGYANTADIDDIEQAISNAIDLQNGDIAIPPFQVLNTQTLTPVDMSYTAQTVSVGRKVVRYEHILSGVY